MHLLRVRRCALTRAPPAQADLHFRATGQENWAPLLLFVGFLGVIVVAARALRTPLAANSARLVRRLADARRVTRPPQTLVYTCLQHSAALEAASTAERLARYRASAHGSAARALHVPYVSYDARTLTARGTPLYGGFDAAGGAIYTATVVAPAHSFAPLQRYNGAATPTGAEMQPRGAAGGGGSSEPPSPRSPSYGGGASYGGGSGGSGGAPRLPTVLSVGADGVSAGVPAYPEHPGTAQPQVIPAFRWEPLRPLPGGAQWVPATTAVAGAAAGHAAVGGASIGGWGAAGAMASAPNGRAPPQSAPAARAREAPPQQQQAPPLSALSGLPALRTAAAPAPPDASRRQWRSSSGGGGGNEAL